MLVSRVRLSSSSIWVNPHEHSVARAARARLAVLRAVDNMLVEEGYAAMTMKGIAERAKVGRQTVYRWWSSKAEILLEASTADATRELTISFDLDLDLESEITSFLVALSDFLTGSDAGLAYRALPGESQHGPKVAELLRDTDVLGHATRVVIRRVQDRGQLSQEGDVDALVAELVAPLVFRILTEGWTGEHHELQGMARRFLVR